MYMYIYKFLYGGILEGLGFRGITPIMENPMEKNSGKEWGTRITVVLSNILLGGYYGPQLLERLYGLL